MAGSFADRLEAIGSEYRHGTEETEREQEARPREHDTAAAEDLDRRMANLANLRAYLEGLGASELLDTLRDKVWRRGCVVQWEQLSRREQPSDQAVICLVYAHPAAVRVEFERVTLPPSDPVAAAAERYLELHGGPIRPRTERLEGLSPGLEIHRLGFVVRGTPGAYRAALFSNWGLPVGSRELWTTKAIKDPRYSQLAGLRRRGDHRTGHVLGGLVELASLIELRSIAHAEDELAADAEVRLGCEATAFQVRDHWRARGVDGEDLHDLAQASMTAEQYFDKVVNETCASRRLAGTEVRGRLGWKESLSYHMLKLLQDPFGGVTVDRVPFLRDWDPRDRRWKERTFSAPRTNIS